MARIRFQSTTSGDFELEFNTERTFEGAYLNCYATGDSYRASQSHFEVEDGFVILDFFPIIRSEWGEHGYSTTFMAKDGNFERFEKIVENFEELYKQDIENNDEKNKEEINWIRKYLFEYYQNINTSNAHFVVDAWAKSHSYILDTKTGNIEMYFTFRVRKLLTPTELNLLKLFIDETIRAGGTIKHTFIESTYENALYVPITLPKKPSGGGGGGGGASKGNGGPKEILK